MSCKTCFSALADEQGLDLLFGARIMDVLDADFDFPDSFSF